MLVEAKLATSASLRSSSARCPIRIAPSKSSGGSSARAATFSIAAGVSLFALARRMGTSLEMIDQTYGHLAPDADDYELGLLDAFDARISSAAGHFLDTAH